MDRYISILFFVVLLCAFRSDGNGKFPACYSKGYTLVFSEDLKVANGKVSHFTGRYEIISDTVANGNRLVMADYAYHFEDGGTNGPYRCLYGSDSSNFYTYMQNNYGVSVTNSGDNLFRGDSLIFPYAMKVGDTLPGAHVEQIAIDEEGPRKASEIVVLHRKVIELDTLVLPIGKIPAYKIESTYDLHLCGTYAANSVVHYYSKQYDWFSPNFGVVQTETNQEDQVSRTTLIKITSPRN